MTTKSLIQFIEDIGDNAAAELFGVKPRTTMSWRLRQRRPKSADIPELIRKSGGVLTYESFFDQDTAAA